MNIKIFKKAYDDMIHLQESERLFKRSGLTTCEYELVYNIMKNVNEGKEYNPTISEKVANWFSKHKFKVKPEGIGWVISL